jgi:caffeoyl-CoA O-methyltransferase
MMSIKRPLMSTLDARQPRRNRMPISTATISTASAARHIEWLTSNLDHQELVALGVDGRAEITVGQGTCVLAPSGDGLSAIAAAPDRDGLAGVQAVLARRLESAPGEELRVSWTPPFSGGSMRITDSVVDDYLLGHCTPADGVLGELVAETREATGGASTMQVSADEGALLTMLTRMVNARFAVEAGVFTGYSSICIARGLAAGGRLLACDTSQEWTAIARRYWQRAGVADRIDLTIGPAIETLRALPADPPVDIAFIDADKAGYPAYYEELLGRLRSGGVIAWTTCCWAAASSTRVTRRNTTRRCAASTISSPPTSGSRPSC